ncbi:MAG: hypothetical protein H7835_18905 [Magnetococcus sp. XQGC-1]
MEGNVAPLACSLENSGNAEKEISEGEDEIPEGEFSEGENSEGEGNDDSGGVYFIFILN